MKDCSITDQSNGHWKSFDSGTEAGRLLARLYGTTASKTEVKYPKVEARPSSSSSQPARTQWRTAKSGTKDPREAHFNRSKALGVKVPRVGNKERSNISASVDKIAKRRSQGCSLKEIENCELLNVAYRPPHKKPFSTFDEKDRLNEIFACKGGSALPEELTNPKQTESPSESKWKAQEARRLESVKAKRRGNGRAFLAGTENRQKNHQDLLYEEILLEIEERRDFQNEMEKLGAEFDQHQVSQEIEMRLAQLAQLDHEQML